MKTAYDLEKRIRKAMKSLPKLVAEEAAEYSRRRFAEKNFDGKPWKPLSPHYHPTRGTLLVRSGALLNSVRVVSTSQEKVVIGAGNSKVKYAKAHNEGFSCQGAQRGLLRQRGGERLFFLICHWSAVK